MWNFLRKPQLQLTDHERRMRRYALICFQLIILLMIVRAFFDTGGEYHLLKSQLPAGVLIFVAFVALSLYAFLGWCLFKWVYVRECGRILIALFLIECLLFALPVTLTNVLAEIVSLTGIAMGYFMLRTYYPPDEQGTAPWKRKIADDLRWIAHSIAGWIGFAYMMVFLWLAIAGQVTLQSGKQIEFTPLTVTAFIILLFILFSGPLIALWKELAGGIVTVWISLIFFIAVCLHPGFQIFMVALGYMSIGVAHIVAARMSKAAATEPPKTQLNPNVQ